MKEKVILHSSQQLLKWSVYMHVCAWAYYSGEFQKKCVHQENESNTPWNIKLLNSSLYQKNKLISLLLQPNSKTNKRLQS